MSGDGSRVFYCVRLTGDSSNPNRNRGTIYLRRQDSDVPERLAEDVAPDWMYVDHKGQKLYYGMNFEFREGPDFGHATFYSLDVETRQIAQLLSRTFTGQIGRVVWAEAGQKLIIAQYDGILWDLPVSKPAARLLGRVSAGVLGVWTDPDGEELYLGIDNEERGVWRFERSTGKAVKLVTLPPGAPFWQITVSPDRKRVWMGDSQDGVFCYKTDSQTLEELFPGGRLLAASANGARLLVEAPGAHFGLNQDGSPEIFLINSFGQPIRQVTSGTSKYSWTDITMPNPACLSQDGSSFVIIQARRSDEETAGYRSQWLLRGAENQAAMTPLEFASETYSSLWHVLSDSPYFIYSTSGGTGPGITLARLDGSQAKAFRLPSCGSFSPNAGAVASLQMDNDGSLTPPLSLQLYRVSTGQAVKWPTGLKAVFSGIPHDYWPKIPISGLRVDDHGRFVVFQTDEPLSSKDSGAAPLVYALDFRDPSPVIRFLGPGSSPQISADGRRIVFSRSADNVASTVTLDTRDWQLKELAGYPEQLSADGNWIVGREEQEIVWRRASDGHVEFRVTIDAPGLSPLQISSDATVAAGSVTRPEDQSRFVVAYTRNGDRSGTVELPQATGGWTLSGDGHYVLFLCACETPDNPDASTEIFAASIGASTISAQLAGVPGVTGLALVNSSDHPTAVDVDSFSQTGKPDAHWAVSLPAGSQVAEVIDPRASATAVRAGLTTSAILLTAGQDLETLEGTPFGRLPYKDLLVPLLPEDQPLYQERVVVLNPNSEETFVTTRVQRGFLTLRKQFTLAPYASLSIDPRADLGAGEQAGLVTLSAPVPISAEYRAEEVRAGRRARFGVPAVDPRAAASTLVFSFAATAAPFSSTLLLLNPGEETTEVRVAMADARGREDSESVRTVAVMPHSASLVTLSPVPVGQVHVNAVGEGQVTGTVIVRNTAQGSAFAEPGVLAIGPSVAVPYFAQTENLFTAFSLANPHPVPVRYTVFVKDSEGRTVAEKDFWIPASGQQSKLLTEVGEAVKGTGYFLIRPERSLYVTAVLSTVDGSSVAQLLGP